MKIKHIKKIVKNIKSLKDELVSLKDRFNSLKYKLVSLKISISCLLNRNLSSTMEDGLLRIRITHRCNSKCRYCGVQFYSEENQKASLDPKILYEYCKPLYEKIKILLLTGGDPLVAKESNKYCEFITKNYPALTLYLETNGIALSPKWQELAMKNLANIHISLNASNEKTYQYGCWAGEAGAKAYRKVHENLNNYMKLLKENNLEVFAPDVSMVINKDTASDIRNFVKYSLKLNLKFCMFFFDYTENDMCSPYFGCAESSREALRELMKIERVLAKKFFVYFRLWIPLKEVQMMQPEIERIPIEELRKEYADILELAKNRSMKDEYEKRQQIRKEHGKKTFTFDEDWTPTIHQISLNGKNICAAPFKMFDIYPDATAECCGWVIPRIDLKNWVKHDKIDWNKLYNSLPMKKMRLDMINDDFSLCQKCCPLNPECNEVCPPHKYGFERGEE